MRRRDVAAVAAVALILGGYGAADAADVLPRPWPGILTMDEPWEEPTPFPTVSLGPVADVPEVLADLSAGAPLPEAARLDELAGTLLADPRIAPGAGVVVLDALTGQVLLDRDARTPRVPASTVKLLTTSAALGALGADTRLSTRVLADPDVATSAAGAGVPAGTIYLVGGGDVLLAPGGGDPEAVLGRAGLGDLAGQAAQALRIRGVGSVRLVLDDTAFSEPATAPGWSSVDLQFVSPVSPLAVDRGIVAGRAARDPDPALTAARAFASALSAQGLDVEADVVRGPAPGGAAQLAVVESATVAELVEHTLRTSDNDVAEVLARRVALAAGLPGDFVHGTAAVLARLSNEGLDVSAVRMADASGLSEQDAVPPLVLARLLARVADPARPDLLPVADGLPVAGLDGTLSRRFDDTGDLAAGVLRAKTGTLVTASALAGLVLDADDRLLAFAVLAEGVPVGGLAPARAAMDSFVSGIAACGCA